MAKSCRTRADKSNLYVGFCTLSVHKSVQLNATDKVHSVRVVTIREIPDHATFRGKGVNTGLVR